MNGISRWPRAAAAVAGVGIMILVGFVVRRAGASRWEVEAVLLAAVLYSLLVVVLTRNMRKQAHHVGSSQDAETGATRRTKRGILTRLLFQMSLFCFGSWLLMSGSPDMGGLENPPFGIIRFSIVGVGLCLMLWRAFRATRLLRQLDQRPR
jgi:hypothetical protein